MRQRLLSWIRPFRNPHFYEWFFRKTPLGVAMRAKEEDAVLGLLEPVIKPNHSILEVGSGPGNYTVFVARRCKDMVAIDRSPKMLQYLRKRLNREGLVNVETRLGSLPDRLETTGKFDGVLVIGVFYYEEEFEKSLRTLASALKPDGWAVFDVSLATAESRIWDTLTTIIGGWRPNLFSLEEAIDAVERAGLRVQATATAGISRGGQTLVIRAVV